MNSILQASKNPRKHATTTGILSILALVLFCGCPKIARALNMFPSFPCDDVSYGGDRHSKTFPQIDKISTFESLGAYLKNLLYFQFRKIVVFSASICIYSTTFFIAISHVVAIRADKKMVRSNTRRIITFMKDQQTFRNFSEMDLPRDAVSLHIFPTMLQTDGTVAAPFPFDFTACPKPTRRGFINFFPESIYERFAQWARRIHIAFLAAKSSSGIGGWREDSMAF